MTDTPDLHRLLDIMARLRDPERGCPWDVAQSFRTIAPYTIEEAYEVAEAAESGDDAALKDELGDLLLQVVFHARMAEQEGRFAFNDVAAAISDKMIRRHPHVFSETEIVTPSDQIVAWEALKAQERRAKAEAAGTPESALDGVGVALPALTRAVKLQRRAARVGFDWPDAAPVFDKIQEEIGELEDVIAEGSGAARLADELGDLLFSVVNLARKLDLDPEQSLRGACRKFERRFRAVEQNLVEQGITPAAAGLDRMEAAWEAVKDAE